MIDPKKIKIKVNDLLDRMQENGELPLIELHVIRAIGPTLLNRDLNNQVKKITFGGTTRIRFSSQSLMKKIRDYRNNISGSRNVHSRCLPESIAKTILVKGEEYEELADKVREAMSGDKNGQTKTIVVYSDKDVDDIAGLIINKYNNDKKGFLKDPAAALKELEGAMTASASARGIDDMTALKGRMSTDTQFVESIEAAASVNHAYSVDEWAGDIDSFVATDDASNPAGRMLSFFGGASVSGGGMIDTLDVSANVFYQYANIDTRTLLQNVLRGIDLDDKDAVDFAIKRMHRIVADFIEDFALLVPDAKQHSMASYPMPLCMLVTERKWARAQSADREYVDAIEDKSGMSVSQQARDRLVDFANNAQTGAFASGSFEKVFWLEDDKNENIPQNAKATTLNNIRNELFTR